MKKRQFTVTGMSCAACSSRVNKAVAALNGVKEVNVNLLKNRMNVEYDDTILSEPDISAAVEKAGYGAFPADENKPLPAEEKKDDLKIRLILSVALTAVLMLFSGMAEEVLPPILQQTSPLTQLLLTGGVVFLNRSYFVNGFKALFRKSPTMDSLIALGAGAAFSFSIYGVYRVFAALSAEQPETGQSFARMLYFDSAAMILTLITLGKFLEAGAKRKTADAVSNLLLLTPQTAVVLHDEREETIPVDQLKTGDIVVIKRGARIPADGVVTQGAGTVDESALTGESMPVGKTVGDSVMSACVSLSGFFLMRAEKVGRETALAQIVKLVDEASSSKAPIARLADKISGVFALVVICLALLTAAVWLLCGASVGFALTSGVCVLVISCPCALGLATPTAIMVGTGRGAKQGVLFKSAASLERAGQIDTVALDKTGTLTEGRPRVTDVITTGNVSETELIQIAASLETLSEHPLGLAVAAYAKERLIPLKAVSGFRQKEGRGIFGTIGKVPCQIGNALFLEEAGIENTLKRRAQTLAEQAKTPLYCVKGNVLIGIIGISDPLKKNGAAAVSAFKKMGLDVVLLTGDNQKTAQAIAGNAGIDTVFSNMLPQDKEAEIRRLQENGKKVVMIGDGINDAPALARADVGMAIGAGTDIAIDSADVVLIKDDLAAAVFAVRLGKAVLRNIKENLFWAFFYNSVGIPVAAGVFFSAWGWTLDPAIAAAAMSFSSVSVVMNALRLRRFKDKPLIERRNAVMTKELMIEGMKCEHCAKFVAKALREVDGVEDVLVDLAAKKAKVEATKKVSDDSLKAAVAEAGFEVVGIADV